MQRFMVCLAVPFSVLFAVSDGAYAQAPAQPQGQAEVHYTTGNSSTGVVTQTDVLPSGATRTHSSSTGDAQANSSSTDPALREYALSDVTVPSSGTSFTQETTQSTNAVPTTGGEPLLMSLFGCLIAGGAAWGKRRLR